MKVIYTGTADLQLFSKADFAKAGVEHKATQFPHGEPVEVSDEVGQLLIADDGVFGLHLFKEAPEEEAPETKSDEEAPKDQSTDSGGDLSSTGSAKSRARR